MTGYVYGHDQTVARFVAMLIPRCRERGFGPNVKAIGVIDDDGALIAGVVYHNWDPDSEVIEMSAAALPGLNWLTRETLRRIYEYPFEQIGCQMVIKRVMADHERMLSIFARVGCTFYKVRRMWGREHDGVLVTLTREDWENSRIGQRVQRPAEPSADIEEAA